VVLFKAWLNSGIIVVLEVDVQVQVQKKKGVEEYITCSSLTWDGIETAHPHYTQLLLPVISG